MKFSDINPRIQENDDKFNTAVEVTNRIFKILDEEDIIWIQTSLISEFAHVYVYSNETSKYLCKTCLSNGRYSRAKMVKLPTDEYRLFEYQEHGPECCIPLKSARTRKFNGPHSNYRSEVRRNTMNKLSAKAIVDEMTSGKKFGRPFKKVTDRSWKLSTDGKRFWCQSKVNSSLYFLCGCNQRFLFQCQTCHRRKRHSVGTIISDLDGTKTLWTIENHEQDCFKSYEQIMSHERRMIKANENRLKYSMDIQNEEYFLTFNDYKDSIDSIPSTSTNELKYGDLYKCSNPNLSNALKITSRTWKVSKDGKFVMCQR
uniref:Uncharacterized protein n=1 Tax=Panagrolaimus sp. JU765 TaxID=591449 RepID=A0AC34RMM4_9BILA